ncbi:triose-phosphate isomerase [Blochmannia endosymbiont of Polyrhachis (Hedomyrma) turneri]|uniref:triose-phosphate isomerase n=1 Tax=Blochmannia endosymbiont of Polyrhachis (Hedomyrma) turneri TaxID=1505596 RepID=UPI00061A7BD9|nr:triose-phosphate isomerase [Blochmannia endosymbiont of Polyrhachis (Hedomyrma) turneri]AKC60153.1 triosephosphate isomerase [Blochmannia endosymbiont of Polyrhachis (Hedomyrma) turneri]
MRKCLIVANWKLNNNTNTIKKFFHELKKNDHIIINTACHIAIAPSLMYLYLIKKYTINYPNIDLAAQNVDIHLSGAFTGDISAAMLKDIGVRYVIIGHSERKKYHKENNKNIAKKFEILKKTGLTPILCIGENQQEKKNGQTESICATQLETIFKLLGPQAFENAIIAYEPIWAIGTGITDTPENIQATHNFIRNYIAHYNTSIANQTIIQYGGSVNHTNINNLLIQPDIDGVLVGTASLTASTFTKIIKHAQKIKYSSLKINNI